MTRPEKPIFTADSINQEPFSETTTSFTAVVVSSRDREMDRKSTLFYSLVPSGGLDLIRTEVCAAMMMMLQND